MFKLRSDKYKNLTNAAKYYCISSIENVIDKVKVHVCRNFDIFIELFFRYKTIFRNAYLSRADLGHKNNMSAAFVLRDD